MILVKIGCLKAVLFLGAQMKFHLCVYPETMRHFESKERLLQHLIHHLQSCYLATTCNKNEQQQDAKNNAEIWKTKWTKAIWKTFEATIRRGRNWSVKV